MMEKPIWWDYAIFYPDEDEKGFDGIHYGGIKGVAENTPLKIRKEYEKYKAENDRMVKEKSPMMR